MTTKDINSITAQLSLRQNPEPFIGRQMELSILDDSFRAAIEGHGQAILLNGSPGIGKSQLAAQFIQNRLLDSSIPFHRLGLARCSSIGGYGAPASSIHIEGDRDRLTPALLPEGEYVPLLHALEMLQSPFNLEDDGILTNLRERFESISEDYSRKLKKYRAVSSVGILAINVAGIWHPEILFSKFLVKFIYSNLLPKHERSSGKIDQQRISANYLNHLSKLAKDDPLVIFLDDLHLADPASVNLLTHVVSHSPNLRLLIIGNYRPADVRLRARHGHPLEQAISQMVSYPWVRKLDIKPFTEDESRLALAAMSGDNEYPDEILNSLCRLSGGNPLHLSLSLDLLKKKLPKIASENIAEINEANKWLETELPGDIRDLIRISFDAIERETSELLERGSVEGQYFHTDIIKRLLEKLGDLPNEYYLLERLRAADYLYGLIKAGVKDSADPMSYINQFTNTLVQQVFYYNLTGEQRDYLHNSIAEILELELDKNDWVQLGKIAKHYYLGNNLNKALPYSLMVAEKAIDHGAIENALPWIEQCKQLLQEFAGSPNDELKYRAELFYETARASAFCGKLDAAKSNFEEVLKLTDNPRFLLLQIKAIIEVSHIYRITGNPGKSEALLKAAFEKWNDISDLELKATLIEEAYTAARRLPMPERVRLYQSQFVPLLHNLQQIAHNGGNKEIEVYALRRLGGICTRAKDFEAAKKYLNNAWDIAMDLPISYTTVMMHYAFIDLYQQTEQLDLREREFQRLLEHVCKADLPLDRIEAIRNYSIFLQDQNRNQEALSQLREAFIQAKAIGSNELLRMVAGTLATLAEKSCSFEIAIEAGEAHLKAAQETGVKAGEFGALLHLTYVAIRQNNRLNAEYYFNKAKLVFAELDASEDPVEYRKNQINLDLIECALEVMKGDMENAKSKLDEINSRLDAMNDTGFSKFLKELAQRLGINI